MIDKNKILSEFKSDLKDLYNEKLCSIIIYGSCAVDDCSSATSDINAIVILDQLSALDLKKSHNIIKKWIKTKNPLPIFMDKEEWFNSTDIYPIEYSDIKERYKILEGEDVVAPLILKNDHLRLMCEHEIKNILIKLRQNYLINSSNYSAVKELIFAATKSLIAILRATLRLTNLEVPKINENMVDLLSSILNIDKNEIIKLFEIKNKQLEIKKDNYESTIQFLIDTTDKILKSVDKL